MDPAIAESPPVPTPEPAGETYFCVEISVDAQGAFSVGAEPTDEANKDRSYMQPAKSLDDALSVARDLIANKGAVADATESDMAQGYKNAAGGSPFGGPSPTGPIRKPQGVY